jgi:hypothetical protein
MLEQAAELRIEFLRILHTVQVVALRHPFDVQDHQRDGQWIVRENSLGDRAGRADEQTFRCSPAVPRYESG